MDGEQVWGTPEVVIGQIAALKMMHFSDGDAAEKIKEWGFPIGKPTAGGLGITSARFRITEKIQAGKSCSMKSDEDVGYLLLQLDNKS